MTSVIQRCGLTELYVPEDRKAITLDVVFVHGLFGHPCSSWTRAQDTQSHDDEYSRTQARGLASLANRIGKRKGMQTTPLEIRPKTARLQEDMENGLSTPEVRGSYAEEPEPPYPSAELEDASDPERWIFWPRDKLKKDLPNARIFTWGYDVDIDHMFSSSSQNSVFQHAKNLMHDLSDVRVTTAEKSVPLVFVAHSLGGIVIKDALSQSSMERTYLKEILPSTLGVCFVGTPHRGSSTATVGKVAFDISKAMLKNPNTRILRSLEVNSENLDRISRSFSQVLVDRKLNIHSFHEELPTNGAMIVQSFSYAIGDGLETSSGIHANHRNMPRSTAGQKKITAVLRRWEQQAISLRTEKEHSSPHPIGLANSMNLDSKDSIEVVSTAAAAAKGKAQEQKDLQDCVKSLDYLETKARLATVEDHFDGTYAWLYDFERCNFPVWLTSPRAPPIFWIQGKPGCGKSTLMKFACQHHMTKELLARWGAVPWLVASFFFHERGSVLQKSIQGLLLGMLHQLLKLCPALTEIVLPIYLSDIKAGFQSAGSRYVWPVASLQGALLAVITTDKLRIGFCLFVDALDEHSGNHRDLLRLFANLNNKRPVKLCLASRPENVFVSQFHANPGIVLQDFTTGDIRNYTYRRLCSDASIGLDEGTDTSFKSLAREVTEKAQGVFIWVKLVVDQLVQGWCEGDPLRDLRLILQNTPLELDDLYRQTLARIRQRNLSKGPERQNCLEAYILFQIVLVSPQTWTLQSLMSAVSMIMLQQNLQNNDVMEDSTSLKQMHRRLTSRCWSLLEVRGVENFVQFTHETVRHFIEDRKNLIRILFDEQQELEQLLNPHRILCDFHLSQITAGNRESLELLLYHGWYLERDVELSMSHHLTKLLRNHQSRVCVKSFVETTLSKLGLRNTTEAVMLLNDPLFLLCMTAIIANLYLPIREHAAAIQNFGQAQMIELQVAAITAPGMRSQLKIGGSGNGHILREVLRHSQPRSVKYYGQSLIQLALTADCAYVVPVEEHAQRIEILLQHGEDPNEMFVDFNERGSLWWPPLQELLRFMTKASSSELEIWTECAKSLISHGVNVNLRDWTGRTPLFFALHHDYEPMILLLLKYGAVPEPLNCNGFSALTCDPTQVDWGLLAEQNWSDMEMNCRKFRHLLLKNQDLVVDTADKTLGHRQWPDYSGDEENDDDDAQMDFEGYSYAKTSQDKPIARPLHASDISLASC